MFVFAGSRQNESASSHSRLGKDFPHLTGKTEISTQCVCVFQGWGVMVTAGKVTVAQGFTVAILFTWGAYRSVLQRATSLRWVTPLPPVWRSLFNCHNHSLCHCPPSSSLLWIRCESTLISLPTASRPEKQTLSSAPMKTQWQPCPKTRITCVGPPFPLERSYLWRVIQKYNFILHTQTSDELSAVWWSWG